MTEYTTENIGCYFHRAFGYNYNGLRILNHAKEHGFTKWSSRLEQKIYSPNGEMKDRHYEEWIETIDDAITYLNHNTTRPDNTHWDWIDGDFGLWLYCKNCGEVMHPDDKICAHCVFLSCTCCMTPSPMVGKEGGCSCCACELHDEVSE
jgi:hypothetical protein